MPSCQPCAERFTGARVVKTVTGVTRDLCVLTSTPSNERRERLLVWRFAWNRKWSQVRTFLWLGQSRLGACHNKVTRVNELSRGVFTKQTRDRHQGHSLHSLINGSNLLSSMKPHHHHATLSSPGIVAGSLQPWPTKHLLMWLLENLIDFVDHLRLSPPWDCLSRSSLVTLSW